MIEKLNTHYSFTNPASVYDEEAMTSLELAGRQGAKINEVVEAQNNLDEKVNNHLVSQDKKLTEIEEVEIPLVIESEINKHIDNGTFDNAIDEYVNNLSERVDSLLGTVVEGTTTLDAEVIDLRTPASAFPTTEPFASAGESIRTQLDGIANGVEGNVNNYNITNFLNSVEQEVWSPWWNKGTKSDGYVTIAGTLIPSDLWDSYSYDVTFNERYKISTYSVDVAKAIILLNKAGKVVKTYPDDGVIGIGNYEITIPLGVTTMIVNLESSVYSNPTVDKLTAINKSIENGNINFLNGKKLICLGDSITAGAGVTDKSKVWGNLIAQRNNMNFTNAGISGSTMGESVSGTNTNPCWKNERYKAIEGNDYAIIWFGWNDYNFCKLGTVDVTNAASFLGAYYSTLRYIVENYVTTKVGVIIPYIWLYPSQNEPQGYSIMALMNGLKEVCKKCGVPYLDINEYNFLQSWGSDYPNDDHYYIKWDARQKVYTSDGLHPNEAGNEYLSTIIEGFIKTL